MVAPRVRATGTPVRLNRKLTFPELEALWIGNGGDPSKAELAAAIASAEQGKTALQTSPNPSGGINRGPWQVDSVSHPDIPDPSRDLNGYVKGIIRITGNGKNWGQWQTYAQGTYKKYLIGKAPDKTLLEKLATSGAGDAVAGAIKPLEPLAQIANVITTAGGFLLTQEGWRRILKVVIGGVVLLWGINMLSKSLTGSDPLGGAAKVVNPVARAQGAKLVGKS